MPLRFFNCLRPWLARLSWAGLLVLATPPLLGRPLDTDGADAAPARECQFETWVEHAGDADALVLATACGLVDGLELGADLALPRPRDPVRLAAGLSLKWAPAAARWVTPWGELALGLAGSVAAEDDQDAGWRAVEQALVGLASLEPADGWALHLNLGRLRDRQAQRSATVLGLAATWAPSPAWLLGIEWQDNDRHEHFGGASRGAGLRWWWRPDTLALDLTASRSADGGPTLWTVGLGWYGLSF